MYADGIVHAIDESSILVLILSGQAVASAHVGREIERAVSKRRPVVALRIDAAFEYFLNQSQWVSPDGVPTRLNVASDRANDGTRMYRLGRLARDGVMLVRHANLTAVTRNDSVMA
jgi:antiphage defense system Thoeris ThsB-like protein